jgi:hypothetical protein
MRLAITDIVAARISGDRPRHGACILVFWTAGQRRRRSGAGVTPAERSTRLYPVRGLGSLTMIDTATILELRCRSGAGMYAIPYRSRRCGRARRLLDGSIVERPTLRQRMEAPDRPATILELAAGGGPATIHHANLGLVAGYLELAGVYLLPGGDVAAVYGAEAVPIDARNSESPGACSGRR